MSELTPCNYCSLRDMQRRAKKGGTEKIILRRGYKPDAIAGLTVYEFKTGTRAPTTAAANPLGGDE